MKKIVLSLALILSSTTIFAHPAGQNNNSSLSEQNITNVLVRPAALSPNTIKMINEARGEDPSFRQRYHRMKVWCQKNKNESICERKQNHKMKSNKPYRHHIKKNYNSNN